MVCADCLGGASLCGDRGGVGFQGHLSQILGGAGLEGWRVQGLRFDSSDEEVRGFLGILMGPFGIVLMLWECSEGEAGRVDKERRLLPVSALSQCEECKGGLLGAAGGGDEKVGVVLDVWRCGWMPRARRGCSWKASELCMLQGRKRRWRCL